MNKGNSINPNDWSRLVAMEFNTQRVDGLVTSTTPLEALKMLISCAATKQGEVMEEEEEEQVVMVNDIARAYFVVQVVRAISVELPEEDG